MQRLTVLASLSLAAVVSAILLYIGLTAQLIPFTQVVVIGLLIGGVFALLAVSLSIVYGVLNLPNFAHGDFMILAAYAGFFAFGSGLPIAWVVVPALLLGGLGLALGTTILRPRTTGYKLEEPLLVTFGLSLIIENLMTYFWTGNARLISVSYSDVSLNLGWGLVLPVQLSISCAAGILATYSLWFILSKTKMGKSIRAVAQDSGAASMMGMDVPRIQLLALVLGFAYIGVTGVLWGVTFSFDPVSGITYTLVAFTVVTIGGAGNIRGILVGGFLLALSESIGAFVVGTGFTNIVGYVIFIIFLLAKPTGLFSGGRMF